MSPVQKVPLILKLISDHYDGADLVHVPKSRQTNPLNEPRYLAMLLIRKHTPYTFDWIARKMNERNVHERIAHIEARIKTEPALKRKVEAIDAAFIEYINTYRTYEPV